MKLEEALEKIYSMHQFGIKLGLENTEKLLAYLGNPEKKLSSLHIAGSNGKGSTACFMASMLQESGVKTGLFTSPHLIQFNERVRINGNMIPDEYITNYISEMDSYIRENEPTFFELTTAMAFKYFAEEQIDIAVIETGLGGRLDSTNVLDSIASIITSISQEHTNVFGFDIKNIAFEKAGIIKKKKKTFLGILPDIAEKEIRKIAVEKDNEIFGLKENLKVYENHIQLNSNKLNLNLYRTPLAGFYQFYNSALAALVLTKTNLVNSGKHILSGIENVLINTGYSGRYEVYSENPKVIFDAAHNPESLDWFIKEFSKEKNKYKKTTLIFGAMRDKDVVEMLKKLDPLFDEMRFAGINYERALKPSELIDAAGFRKNVFEEHDPAKYIKLFSENNSGECLVVLGSIYLLGKIKEKLKKS